MVIYVSSFKIFLKAFVISGWCLAIFIGAGYYYISSQIAPVEIENESVPYYRYIPENKGLLFKFGTRTVYTYLDFTLSSVTVIINPEDLTESGYQSDYTINADYGLIADMVDYFEGISLDLEGEPLRYTGLQVVDLLSKDTGNELRQKIISSLFLKISQQGVGVDFFNSIITNSKTDLKLPDCYFWTDNMAEVSKNLIFLNNNG